MSFIRRTRRHIGGNLVAYLALFVALGGTSFAAAARFTGADIVDESLTGADVKNSSLSDEDIKNSSLTGNDVKDSSLSGDDVENSGLTGNDIRNSSLSGDDVENSSISGEDIRDSSVTGSDIKSGSIQSSDLAPGAGGGSGGIDETLTTAFVPDEITITPRNPPTEDIGGPRLTVNIQTSGTVISLYANGEIKEGCDGSSGLALIVEHLPDGSVNEQLLTQHFGQDVIGLDWVPFAFPQWLVLTPTVGTHTYELRWLGDACGPVVRNERLWAKTLVPR